MDELSLRLSDGTTIVVPASLNSITTYVVLEQEAWFEKEMAFLARWLRPGMTAIDIGDRSSETVERRECGGLFVFIGADAETRWLPAEIARDARGYVLTGDEVVKAGRWSHDRDPYLLETSVPGIFACGDVRLSPVKRVAAAVGDGSMAIALVHQYLQREAESGGPRAS